MLNGIDLTGLGAVLVGFAAVIGSVASGYMSIKNTKKITDIDHAVNGKPAGAQSLQSQVSDIHSDRPKPPQFPAELNDAAIKEMLRILVADMYDRRKNGA